MLCKYSTPYEDSLSCVVHACSDLWRGARPGTWRLMISGQRRRVRALRVHDGDAWGRLRRQASSLNENAVRPAELFSGAE